MVLNKQIETETSQNTIQPKKIKSASKKVLLHYIPCNLNKAALIHPPIYFINFLMQKLNIYLWMLTLVLLVRETVSCLRTCIKIIFDWLIWKCSEPAQDNYIIIWGPGRKLQASSEIHIGSNIIHCTNLKHT